MARIELITPESDAELAYVAAGRSAFTAFFPSQEDFESYRWDVRHLRRSQHKATNSNIYFTMHGSQADPLPARFSHVVKSYILLNRSSVSSWLQRADAARMLWKALDQRLAAPELFTWEGVTESDLLEAEHHMRQCWGKAKTYKLCTVLMGMIRCLGATPGGPIVRPMSAVFATRRQDDTERYTIAGREERHNKLPPDDAIHAIASLFAGTAIDERDRLVLCCLALMIATAFRIGEALTVPVDCVTIDGEGRDRKIGIRYYKEKSKGGEKALAVRWLTRRQSFLAIHAVRQARKITASARLRARVLESNPDTVPVPGSGTGGVISAVGLAAALGMPVQTAWQLGRTKLSGGKFVAADGTMHFRLSDVTCYLRSIRGDLWTVDRQDGSRQSLSETLFVTFRNFMHQTRGTNLLLVDPIREQVINDWLGGRRSGGKIGVRSLFERFGLLDSTGKPFEMHSHQFRHWVTTKAAEAGVADEVIARWQGREHFGDLAAYKHLSIAERVQTLKVALKSGHVTGPIADMYFSLKDDVRDVFLEGQLQAVHVTPLGLCVHDFKITPCPKHLNCVKDCEDYVLDVRNTRHISNLVQLKAHTALTLEQATQQHAKLESDLSESWISDAKATLAGIERILEAAESKDVVVRPFRGRSRFKKLSVRNG